MKNKCIWKMARNMADMSDFDRQQIRCVVTYKNKVISMGFNSCKTHPLQKYYNKLRFEGDYSPHSLHAEIHALAPIRYMNIDWSKVKVYIFRKSRCNPNQGALARPCPSCMAYMKSLGIKNIYYTSSTTPVHEVLDLN